MDQKLSYRQRLLDCSVPVGSVHCGWGENALHVTARNARLELVQLLLERHADPNYRDSSSRSALHEVANSRPEPKGLEVARLLLKHGAKVDLKDNRGSTPLIDAAEYGNYEMVQLLLDNGASVSARSEIYDGAAQAALYTKFPKRPAAVRREIALLLEHEELKAIYQMSVHFKNGTRT